MNPRVFSRASHALTGSPRSDAPSGAPSCSRLRRIAERVPPERDAAGGSTLNAELAHARRMLP